MTTLKQQIKLAAKNIELTPDISAILQHFFLELSTRKERNRLDAWINEREENDHFFDLLVEVYADGNGTGAGLIKLIIDLTEKPKRKMSPARKWSLGIIIGVILLLVFDALHPSHPVSRLIKGKEIKDPNYSKTQVSTAAETKTVTLPDSSRVILQPHASISYREAFFDSFRDIELSGSATIDATKATFPLRIDAGELELEVDDGRFELTQDQEQKNVLLRSSTARIVIKAGKQKEVIQPGWEGRYDGTRLTVKKMEP